MTPALRRHLARAKTERITGILLGMPDGTTERLALSGLRVGEDQVALAVLGVAVKARGATTALLEFARAEPSAAEVEATVRRLQDGIDAANRVAVTERVEAQRAALGRFIGEAAAAQAPKMRGAERAAALELAAAYGKPSGDSVPLDQLADVVRARLGAPRGRGGGR